MDYTWDFKVVADNFHILLRGVAVTIEPAAGSQTPTVPIIFAAQIG